jgi:hypothetical protein
MRIPISSTWIWQWTRWRLAAGYDWLSWEICLQLDFRTKPFGSWMIRLGIGPFTARLYREV